MALSVATAVKEKLVVVGPAAIDHRELAKMAEARGVVLDRQVIPAGAAELSVVLPRTHERLLVLSRRDAGTMQARQLASSRGVPVLIIEPGRS